MPFLMKNAAAYPNAHIHQADLFAPPCALCPATCLLANPPYIPTGQLDGLQQEVRQEPALALDGGADGLRFYRALAALWLPNLAPGGMLAMECGEGQAEAIAKIFSENTLECIDDFNGIKRVVVVRTSRAHPIGGSSSN
jgi:release factor glutamine methyltransferase